MSLLAHILTVRNERRPLLAVLIDPDKTQVYPSILPHLHRADLILVGGSTGENTEECIQAIREYSSSPIALFPGNIQQFTPLADALLFLTLLNARTPEVLIQPHIHIAQRVINSGIESIPMGYILIDGDRESSVEIAANCMPIPQSDIDKIVSTALAGQLLGKQLIYLEAGSGAKTPVSTEIIQTVRQKLQLPLIVGGGICTTKAMMQAFSAGADIVVIGNHFEENPDEIKEFINAKEAVYGE